MNFAQLFGRRLEHQMSDCRKLPEDTTLGKIYSLGVANAQLENDSRFFLSISLLVKNAFLDWTAVRRFYGWLTS